MNSILLVFVVFYFFFASAQKANPYDSFTPIQMNAYAQKFDLQLNPKIETPEKLWEEIEVQGWPEMLNEFTSKFSDDQSFVVLFNKDPFWPVDMRSGDRLKRSLIKRVFTDDLSIGHMTVGWSCATAIGDRNEGLTAQTGEHLGQSTYLLEVGWGLNALLSTYTDGNMNTPLDIQRYFSTSYVDSITSRHTAPSFFPLVIQVSKEECNNVRNFVKSYILHPSLPWKNFGMKPRPELFEGGGCGSFAVTAISQANSLASLTKLFWREAQLPKSLIGRRTQDLSSDETNLFLPAAENAQEQINISRLRLMVSNWDSNYQTVSLRFVDPELVTFSFRRWLDLTLDKKQSAASNFEKYQQKKLRRFFNFGGQSALTRDGNESLSPYPDQGYLEFDENFDPQIKVISYKVADEFANFLSRGYVFEPVAFPLGVGVMIYRQDSTAVNSK